MKKLSKKIENRKNTVVAFSKCSCSCTCNCNKWYVKGKNDTKDMINMCNSI